VENEKLEEKKVVVKNAWWLLAYPSSIFFEMPDGQIKFTASKPARNVKESELRDYKGHHPKYGTGRNFPDYMFRFYGLEKC
jgi:hypothetical protein